MSRVDWRIQGYDVTNCNCAWGCPCQFMSPPTHSHCQAGVFFRIDRGHFGEVRLDGRALHDVERSARLRQLDRFHRRHGRSPR